MTADLGAHLNASATFLPYAASIDLTRLFLLFSSVTFLWVTCSQHVDHDDALTRPTLPVRSMSRLNEYHSPGFPS